MNAFRKVSIGTFGVLMLAGLGGCPQELAQEDASGPLDAFIAELSYDARTSEDVGADAHVADLDSFVPTDAVGDGGPPDAAGSPDAAGPLCPMEGQTRMRSGACSCGALRQETCTAGSWRATSPCTAMFYECEPGTVEDPYLRPDFCAVGVRRCDTSCRWGEPEWSVRPGICSPGISCSDGCSCTDDCVCAGRDARGECLP